MRRLILAGLACSLLLMQSCSKKENVTSANAPLAKSSKLRVNDVYITATTVPTGTYKFTTCATVNVTNRAMGINASFNLGATAQQVDYTVNTGSDWRVTALGNGYYSIINVFSNMALTLSNAGAAEHTAINQYWYGGIDAQQWKIEYQGGYGMYRIISKVNLLKGAHVDPYQTNSGTPIKLQTYAPGNEFAGYFLLTTVAVAYQDQVATNFFRRMSGVTATDGEVSLKLADGRVFWAVADSHYNDYSNGKVDCMFQKRSVAFVQPSVTNWDWTQLTNYAGTGFQGYFSAPGHADHTWPGGAFQIGNTIYMYTGPSGATATTGTYAHLASIDVSNLGVVTGYTQLTNAGTSIPFGSYVKETDGYMYVFGSRPVPPYNIAADVLVARFPQSNPTAAWTYWNGSSFAGTNVTQAVPVAQMPNRNFSVCKINSKYVILGDEYQMGCGSQSGIYAYTSLSNSPTSAYGAKKTVYNIPDRLNGHIPRYYAVHPHPEFTVNNELLVYYSINDYGYSSPGVLCEVTCVNNQMNPDLVYRPRGIRIPYSVIDPAL